MKNTTAVLIMAWIVVLAACATSTGPGAVASDYYRKAAAGDHDGAYALLSRSSRSALEERYENPERMIGRMVPDRFETEGGIRSIRVVEQKIEDDMAEVRLEVAFESGLTETYKEVLVREDGRWGVDASSAK